MRIISFVACAGIVAVLVAGCTKPAENPATTSTAGTALRVTEIDLGRSLNADKTINDNTNSFKPNDTIYVSIATEGTAPTATIKARWTYQDGQVVDESSQTIAPTGNARTEFHVSKPDGWPAGKYKVEVFVNDVSAGTKEVEVK